MDKFDSSCVLPDSLQPLLQISGRQFHQFYTSDYKNLKNSCHILKNRHPNIKLTVENPYHKTLFFIDCNANINQGNLDTSFKEIKHPSALPLTTTAL